MNFHKKKTLARPMFSMNSWNLLDSGLVPGDSLEIYKFMENIGQANDFHCFFHRNSWTTLAEPMFSVNFWIFLDSGLVPEDSLENHKSWKRLAKPVFSTNFWIFLNCGLDREDFLENHRFREHIGQATLFHEFRGLYQTRTLTKTAQDASKGGVPKQRLLKKPLVNGEVPYTYVCGG